MPTNGMDGGELVLAERRRRQGIAGTRLRRVAVQLGAAALVATVLVGVAGALVSRHLAEQQAVHDVAEMTDLIANSVIQPALTDAMATSQSAAHDGLDRIVRGRVRSDSLVRVKLWAPSGMVLYSDDPRLPGKRFDLDPTAVSALTTPRTVADVSDLQRPENQYERGQGKLLEVYRPVWTPDGQPLLFETYFRYGLVTDRSAQLWRGFSGVMLSSLAALVLLLVPLGGLLVAKSRAERVRRDLLTRHAQEASDEERRRIAAALHDGVVQDLAAVAFTTAGQAERARSRGESTAADNLSGVASAVRGSIADLRSLLVEIYPASLHTAGLSPALAELAARSGATARVLLDVRDDVDASLSTVEREAGYRVAQEALRNAALHADATTVTVRLYTSDEGRAVLEVDDDGFGFDTTGIEASSRDGHFGLQLMADTARAVDAGLVIRTSNEGTSVLMEFAKP